MRQVRLFAFFLACVALCGAAPLLAANCLDADGDGIQACVGGCTPTGPCGDCDDGDASNYPGNAEVCDGADNDCDGAVDLDDTQFNDPDPIDNVDNDDGGAGDVDEGFGYCVFHVDGPGGECVTGGRSVCQWPVGPVPSGVGGFGSLTCVNANNNIILYSEETLASGSSCSNGDDDDCDGLVDLNDVGCQQPETGLCDGLDNDQNGLVDEIFPLGEPGNVGQTCEVGEGECERIGVYSCLPDESDAACSATPSNPKNEGTTFGNSCDNSKDDDCDGLTDLADPDCTGFGDPELCGNGLDDDGDGFTDEGFPTLGLPCSAGVGTCTTFGVLVCKADGTGTECDATAGAPGDESDEVSCGDLLDNDCDGDTDIADASCSSSYADLGVTCSLPYTHAFPGSDCTGKHTITFDGGQATEVQADLLALAEDGSLLGIIEDVQAGDAAHLASRLDPLDYEVDTKTNNHGSRHTVFAPMPILRVTGTKNGVEDVAYCSIMPYLEVIEPNGETISLSEGDGLSVGAYLPLVDVDTVGILLDGVDLLAEVGIDPATDFSTNGSLLCTSPGDCVLQITAGCGDGSIVDVEISNLRVEGIDTTDAPDARSGVEVPEQVNTLSFDVSGLPPGGHIFYISGTAMPLPDPLSAECMVDDLADSGTASAFGITIDAPFDQQVVASAPVVVEGTACGGNEISRLRVNGNEVNVMVPAHQTCVMGDGMLFADECYVDFSEALGETDLALAAAGTAPGGTFKRGSNRVIADASDVRGNRTFNTDVVFGLGLVQTPAAAAVLHLELQAEDRIGDVVGDVMAMMTNTIDPAFVVGLEEEAVQDFFNELCSGAITQFSTDVSTSLSGQEFATFDVKPDCSCDINDIPLVLETLTLTPYAESLPGDPTCRVEMSTDEIGITVNLPDVFVQIGAHDSCTTHGLFGECLARTVVDVTAAIRVENIRFEYVITEDEIETLMPSHDFIFEWDVLDSDGHDFILTAGSCQGGADAGAECIANNFCEPAPGAGTCGKGPNDGDACSSDTECAPGDSGSRCSGGERNGRGCTTDGECPDGSCHANCSGNCQGVVKNDDFEPVTNFDTPIECYGAIICTGFDLLGRLVISGVAELFTWGDFETGKFLGGAFGVGDIQFEEDFLNELALTNPDAMMLRNVQPDADTVAEAGNTAFTVGPIDVEIEDGGLTIALPADFTSQADVSDDDETPGAPLSPAATPTVSEVIAVGSEITMLVADDVFGQMYASMKEAGQLQAFCTNLDGKTVDDLLPAEADGGCDSLGDSGTLAGGTIQGICHAIRDADCETLLGSGISLTALKQGVCHGFEDADCTMLATGFNGIQLPADCDTIGLSAEDSEDPDFNPGRSSLISQGRCHGLQATDCETLTSGGTDQETAFKQGACHGAQGAVCDSVATTEGAAAQEIGTCAAVQGSCSGLGVGAAVQCGLSQLQINITETVLRLAEETACNVTPSKNISGDDGLLLCAAENFEPDLLIREDNTLDNTVHTDLLLNQLDIAFALDRGADGYTGSTLDLPGCFSQEGNEAPDCLIIGVCLNLTLQTAMGIDSSQCEANKAGFTFAVEDVISSGSTIGLVCNAPTETDDQLVVGEGFDSVVVDAIKNAAEAFTPVFCVEGLDLGGVLDFSSPDAKLFGLTTSGATGPGFADYLGITVDLGAPAP